MNRVVIVTRSFQSGSGPGGKEFNAEVFTKKVAAPIRNLLSFDKAIQAILVMVPREDGNAVSEIPNDRGNTPTLLAFEGAFAEEISRGRLFPLPCDRWGKNQGSATALTEGAGIAKSLFNPRWIVNWSVEMALDGYRIAKALRFAEERNLAVVGFHRERWWERPQWNVAQNTCAQWSLEALLAHGGFSAECNGTGRIVHTDEYGDVPLAGMEDFHLMLRMLKDNPEFRWGMDGVQEPLAWDTDFSDPERAKKHRIKVARQYAVMQAWAKDIFPDEPFEKVMDRLFARYHTG